MALAVTMIVNQPVLPTIPFKNVAHPLHDVHTSTFVAFRLGPFLFHTHETDLRMPRTPFEARKTRALNTSNASIISRAC